MDVNRHGSRAGKSTLSQLLEHQDDILTALENGENFDSVYLDFSKAFDKCDHGILLHKIKRLKIRGKLGRWIQNFLTERQQVILVNKVKSKYSKLVSWIPQGSVLGPILFLIYISDIGQNLIANTLVYVDDTKVKQKVKIKILRPLFNTNTPLKPPFRHFGNHFGPRKSDFWPFFLFWSFSHWNSHWSRKNLPTWEGVELERKQNVFWNQWSSGNNLGTCTIGVSEIFENKNPPTTTGGQDLPWTIRRAHICSVWLNSDFELWETLFHIDKFVMSKYSDVLRKAFFFSPRH